MTLPDPSFFRKYGGYILKWWYGSGKDYPWRHEKDPYKILIAEIMLQRTRSDQVVPVYIEFLKKYPDIGKLVNAKPEDIEYFFKKLGLRWRAKKVLEMANYIADKLNGRIPDNREDLLKIPMIGEYIANAVLSVAYGKNAAVIDSNVIRVIGRVLCLEPRGEARRDPVLINIAGMMLPRGRAKEYNWAIIDFAKLICTSRNPKCEICPLKIGCCFYIKTAKLHGMQ